MANTGNRSMIVSFRHRRSCTTIDKSTPVTYSTYDTCCGALLVSNRYVQVRRLSQFIKTQHTFSDTRASNTFARGSRRTSTSGSEKAAYETRTRPMSTYASCEHYICRAQPSHASQNTRRRQSSIEQELHGTFLRARRVARP